MTTNTVGKTGQPTVSGETDESPLAARLRRMGRNAQNAVDWLRFAWGARKPSERRRQMHAFATRHRASPPMRVDLDATEDQLATLTARIEESWRGFGETRPHWSVLTNPQYAPERIGETREKFYTTGLHCMRRVEAMFRRSGADFSAVRHVIDYGCGVGRVSAAFARAGKQVTGADISAPHLEIARAYATEEGLSAEFRRIERLAEIDALPETDLFFSIIVLQHNPPPVMREILRRGLARVRPGGFAWLQVPTYHTGYAYDLAADLAGRAGTMEHHVLPQHALFAALDAAGFVPLEIRYDDAIAQEAVESHCILARRRPGPAAD